MKLFKNLVCCLSILAVGFLASCSQDADPLPEDELEGLKLVTSIKNETHAIYLYSVSGKLTTGYNEIFFQIENPDGSMVANNITPVWDPIMETTGPGYTCPASGVAPVEGTSSLFGGFVVFQTAGNWELPISYHVSGTIYEATGKIPVEAAPKRVVESFQGTDDQKYVIAMLDPVKPVVGANDMSALLYRMKSTSYFESVSGYTIKIDPRMPDNQSSPNNLDLTLQEDGIYKGKLNLNKPGQWRINLQLENGEGEVIMGEPVAGSDTESSIYFEIEL